MDDRSALFLLYVRYAGVLLQHRGGLVIRAAADQLSHLLVLVGRRQLASRRTLHVPSVVLTWADSQETNGTDFC